MPFVSPGEYLSGNARNNILHTLVRMSGWRWFHANCLLFQEKYPHTFEKSMCEYSYICTYTYERPFLSNLQIKNVHLRISSNFPNFYIQISIYLGIFSYIFIFSYCLFFAWTYFPLYFPSGSFKLSGFAAQSKIKTC